MKKKISKMLAMIMILSMVLSVGIVSDVYAIGAIQTYKCDLCGMEFNVADYGSSDAARAAAEAHELTCGLYYCKFCNKEFNASEYEGSNDLTEAARDAHELTCASAPSGTDINLANSTELVNYDSLTKTEGTDYFADETTNFWQDGTIVEETRVTVSKTSTFEITIPKEVVLDGSTGTADYKVKVKGDIAGDQIISVVPDADFILSEAGGKADATAIVTQTDTDYDYIKLQGEGTEYDGNIEAVLTAGEWSGKFNFNIEFKAN